MNHLISYPITALYYTLTYWQFNKNYIPSFSDDTPTESKQVNSFKEYSQKISSIENSFISELEKKMGVTIPKTFMDELASNLFYIRPNFPKNIHFHGFLLYGLLRHYIKNHPEEFITILETGTSHGYSSLCMAKALEDGKKSGKIITIDLLPTNKKIYWSLKTDISGEKTRAELLDKWKNLLTNYIIYFQSYTNIALKQMHIPRINFAFIDANHVYKDVINELVYVAKRQVQGDIIVCDDYNSKQSPGVVKAVKEFIHKNKYLLTLIKNADYERKFAVLTKK